MANANATSPAHTPGPWVLRSNGEITAQTWVGKWDDYICRMPFNSLEEAAEIGAMQLSNARLIAAAPELLEVLRMAREQCERLPDDPETDLLVHTIEAIIAKARGKTA